MNLLQHTTQRPYQLATDVIEAFLRTWDETLSAAPQFKNVALHSLLLLIEHGRTLAELSKLLMDTDFREPMLEQSWFT